jgi:hypothetical protein
LTLGQSLTASPNTMSPAESAEQKTEGGEETRAHDDPHASEECEAGLGPQDGDDQEDGHEEGRAAEANEKKVEEEEEKQDEDDETEEHEEKQEESQEKNARQEEEEAEEEDDDEEQEKEAEKQDEAQSEAEKQDEDQEEHHEEDGKAIKAEKQDEEQSEAEKPGGRSYDEDAQEADQERAKMVTENADASAHQHEELGDAEQAVRKRDRTLPESTSVEIEPPQKVSKCSWQMLLARKLTNAPETGADAEVTDKEQNTLSVERGGAATPRLVSASVCRGRAAKEASQTRRYSQGEGAHDGGSKRRHAGDREDASAPIEVYGRRANKRPWTLGGRWVCSDGHRPRIAAGHRPYGHIGNFNQGCDCEAS